MFTHSDNEKRAKMLRDSGKNNKRQNGNKLSEQVEIARLKCELAKEQAKNQSLREEVKNVRKSLTNEICLLQETVEVQRSAFWR